MNPAASPEVDFDYIDVSSVSNETFVIETTQRMKGKNAPSRARRLVRSRDVLFATIRPTLKRIAITPDTLDRQVCSTGYFVMRPNEEVDHRFLFYYLFTDPFMGAMAALQKGASYPAVTDAEVRAQPIRFPPIGEQRRIVAILDEAFESIATAKAHAEKNLRNAREVQDTYVAALFSTAQDWTVGSLSSFVESISTGPFGSMLHKSDYVDAGVPLVNPINIVAGSIVPTKEKQVDGATAMRLRSYLLRSGDIVVGRRGEIGRCAIVSDTQDGWLCGTGCFFIRPSSHIESSFIAHLIRSAPYRARLEALSTGATMQNLSNDALSGLEVALPGRAEQKRLLAAIDAVSFEADHLCEIYQRKLAALDELKQSLLHQAFSGQL